MFINVVVVVIGQLYDSRKMEEKSILVEYFGTSPTMKILDFLIEGKNFDYSMTEIARNSGVGWSAFTEVWKRFVEKEIVVETRKIGNARLYKLNTENPAVRKLIKFDLELVKLETEKIAHAHRKKTVVR